ncbi:choline/ethanolaminephosphotransferase 1-like [Glandiceps talaboti]
MYQILTIAQLKQLDRYEHNAAGKTFLENVFLDHYWNWLVKKVPLWLSPNLMTLLGLVLNIFIVTVMLHFCPTGTEQAPRWAYLVCFVAYFAFQSLDGIDGKQARRTNTSSALGELLDHGCDTFSLITATISACLALQLGSFSYVIVIMYGVFEQFFSRWQNVVTGTREFGLVDHVEIEVYTMFIFLLPGLFGGHVWNVQIPLIGLQLKMLAVSVYFCFTTFACSRYLSILVSEGFKMKTRRAVLTPVLSMLPVALLTGLICRLSDNTLLMSYPGLYLLLLGNVATKVLNKQLISLLVQADVDLLDWILLWPMLMLLNLCLHNIVRETIALGTCLVLTSLDVGTTSGFIIKQMCDYLGVDFLCISKRLVKKG